MSAEAATRLIGVTGPVTPHRGDEQRCERDGAGRVRAVLPAHGLSEADAGTAWTATAPSVVPEVPCRPAPSAR